MTHIRKLGLLALACLFIFSPAVSHAQVVDGWDYDRIIDLRDELESFQDTFWLDVNSDEDADEAIDYLVEYLEDFDIPEEQPIVVEEVSTSATVTTPGNVPSDSYATFTIRFDVTSADNDLFIPTDAGDKGGSPAVDYFFYGDDIYEGGQVTTAGVLTSTADIKGGYYVVEEGDTETFTLTVTVNPSKAGNVGLSLKGIYYHYGKESHEYFRFEDNFLTKQVYIPDGASVDTYKGYLDGKLFITTRKITEAAALENCKLNETKNPTKSIRCTWGGKEIYRKDVKTVSGTINSSGLTTYDTTPVISGSAKNTDVVGISISNGDKVYGSGDVKVKNGRWSVTVSPALKTGKYAVTLYSANESLASAKLFIESPPVLPSEPNASFDEPQVLPAETTNTKSSVEGAQLSASAALALDDLLAAFKEYLKSR